LTAPTPAVVPSAPYASIPCPPSCPDAAVAASVRPPQPVASTPPLPYGAPFILQALIVVVNPITTLPDPSVMIDRSTSTSSNIDNLSLINPIDPIYAAEESNISSITSGSNIPNPPLSFEESSRLTDEE